MHDWDRARGRKHAARESASRRRKRRFFKTTARDRSSVRAVVLHRAEDVRPVARIWALRDWPERNPSISGEGKRCATGVKQPV